MQGIISKATGKKFLANIFSIKSLHDVWWKSCVFFCHRILYWVVLLMIVRIYHFRNKWTYKCNHAYQIISNLYLLLWLNLSCSADMNCIAQQNTTKHPIVLSTVWSQLNKHGRGMKIELRMTSIPVRFLMALSWDMRNLIAIIGILITLSYALVLYKLLRVSPM